jgi:hypothetical protein
MTTVDHKTGHIWTRTAGGKIRCAYQLCNARPEPADVERLEVDEAARKAMRTEIRYSP